jgi:subtilisin-like proprotein convertase family protein
LNGIAGTTFEDHNGNGLRDGEDQGLQGWTIFLDRNGNGVLDAAASALTVNSGDVPKAIPDLAMVTSSLVVDGVAGLLGDVDVTLDITHTFDSDLAVALISPSGQRVELFSGVGSFADNFAGTVLDDEAATPITTGSAPFSGRFQPEAALANFDGEDPTGTWRLEIRDTVGGDVGTLNRWSLTLAVPVEAEPSDETDTDGHYAFIGLEPGTYRVREVQQAGWRQTTPDPADIVISGSETVRGGLRQPAGERRWRAPGDSAGLRDGGERVRGGPESARGFGSAEPVRHGDRRSGSG